MHFAHRSKREDLQPSRLPCLHECLEKRSSSKRMDTLPSQNCRIQRCTNCWLKALANWTVHHAGCLDGACGCHHLLALPARDARAVRLQVRQDILNANKNLRLSTQAKKKNFSSKAFSSSMQHLSRQKRLKQYFASRRNMYLHRGRVSLRGFCLSELLHRLSHKSHKSKSQRSHSCSGCSGFLINHKEAILLIKSFRQNHKEVFLAHQRKSQNETLKGERLARSIRAQKGYDKSKLPLCASAATFACVPVT